MLRDSLAFDLRSFTFLRFCKVWEEFKDIIPRINL